MGAPIIPREAWEAHKNYPQQVLLLGSHESFRDVSRYLVENALGGAHPSALESLYHRWISGMRSHEAYEEHKLYPYLEKRWQTSLQDAEAGHQALHEAHDEVVAAFAALAKSETGRTRLIAALQRHDVVLRAHLELEEDRVIPMLLGLRRDEFLRYTHTPAHILLGDSRAA